MIVYGTEEQKNEFIPGILSGDIIWCQGYSEPNAGSDLASLEMRAVRDGDDYVINGTKIWSSNAHKAIWCFLLARTDMDAPKHKGISYFLVDMKTPGMTIRPLIDMMNNHGFNEIFFENVRVPRSNLLGEENRGWYMATTTLDFERSSIGGAVGAKRMLDDLVVWCRETKSNGHSLYDEPPVRWRLGEAAVEAELGRLLSYRVVTLQARGQVPNYESSIAKLFNTDMQLRMARSGLEIMGLYGQLDHKDEMAPLQGRFERQYLWQTGLAVGGGTTEIQKNIIAMRGLGLPRQ
jgi:alkylation response protein AidB-like acyl-CoA dehydrogenase